METAIYSLLTVVECVAGILMLKKRRQQNDRSRLLIAVFFFFTAFSTILRLVLAHPAISPNPGEPSLMRVSTIVFGFVVFFLLLLYPLELLRPNWLNIKRAMVIMSPWLFLVLLLAAAAPFGILHISSTEEIISNIGRTDVFLRVALSLIFVPYGLWLMFMQYNWRHSSAPIRWVRAIVLIAMTMTFTFSYNRLFDHKVGIYIHIALYFILTAVILWLELVVRFKVPDSCVSDDVEHSSKPALKGGLSGSASAAAQKSGSQTQTETEVHGEAESVIAVKKKLMQAMNTPEVWQNPELSRGMLCNLVATNSNYLQKAIKSMGYASYSDMINRKRIDYVCRMLKTGNGKNIQDIFYMAGYRSRVTAWRNFTALTGVSPAHFSESETKKFR
ncbi:MAG: helix-turn-helix domain-containing protein [Candidatus Cryptobacteroides sp.]